MASRSCFCWSSKPCTGLVERLILCQSVQYDTLPESVFAFVESQQVVDSRPSCLWWCWRRDRGLHAEDLVQGCLLPSFVVRPEIQYKFPVKKLPLAKHFRNMTNFWKNQKNFSSNSKPWPRRRRPCPRLSVSLQNRERVERAGSLRTCPWPWPWYIGRPDQIWTRWRPWPWYDDPDEGLNVLWLFAKPQDGRERESSVQGRALAVLDLC